MPASTLRIDGRSRQRPSRAAFFHVLREGVLQTGNGISLIEDGGAVKMSSSAPVHFVKHGGSLEEFRNATGLIVQEPGANFGRLFAQETTNSYEWHLKHIVVPQIAGSLGIAPFLFKTPSQAQGEAKYPPSIAAIEPLVASYSDVVMLTGSGFLGTIHVYLDRGMGFDEFPAGRLQGAVGRAVANCHSRQAAAERPRNGAHGRHSERNDGHGATQ